MNGRTERLQAADGHQWDLRSWIPDGAQASVMWLSALGVASRHYEPLAAALAQRGYAVFLHEWRGNGTSSLRPSRRVNWGYREIIELDLPQTQAAVERAMPGMPRIIGGHSLGGQLACCYAGLHPNACSRGIWLVASGSPYFKLFGRLVALPYYGVAHLMAGIAQINGTFPGRRLRFAGKEARGVMKDWSRTAITGRYRTRSMPHDFDALMASLATEVTGITMDDDWLAPQGSLAYLAGKLKGSGKRLLHLSAADLQGPADHFGWMKNPAAVVDRLTSI